MIFSTLLRPPAAPPEEPSGGVRPRRREQVVSRERNRRYKRAVSIGVILSVLVHILGVFVSPLVVRYMELTDFVFVRPIAPTAQDDAMQVVVVRVTETQPVRPEPEPQPEPEPEGPPIALPEPTWPTLTAAEHLRPRVGDWRLWIIPPTRPEDKTPAELSAELNDRLFARLEAWEDSITAALASGDMDWTVGEEGNKWGVSPGKLHLGPVTLPLPLYLGPHPAVQRELGERTQEWYLIRGQQTQQAVDEEFERRVKEMRERAEQERAEKAKNDSTSSQ